jgi:hypothetical protein
LGWHFQIWSGAVAEPKHPALPKMRDWPMFGGSVSKRRKNLDDARALPRIADLVMEHVPGTPAEKLAWLRQQVAAGRLDGDDPDEIAQAEALLVMLARIVGSKTDKQRRHLDELLDEGLRQTFPASDPVSVGHFTSTESPARPLHVATADVSSSAKKRRRRPQARGKR